MPDWLSSRSAAKLLLTLCGMLPGWIALYLTVKRERTILQFSLKATNTEADEQDMPLGDFDGVPFVRALSVAVTNNGLRPITVQMLRCKYYFLTSEGERREAESDARIDKKIGQGEHCSGLPKLVSKPQQILSVCALDSTGREWAAPSAKIKELNQRGPDQWS